MSVLLVIASALLIHATAGYRPFPSIDDFIYLPFSWAKIDPTLYRRDLFVGGSELHLILWPLLVRLSESTVGLEVGFWLITIFLTILTCAAIYRLIAATKLNRVSLPLSLLIICAAPPLFQGIGRGSFDGLIGQGFHAQWLGLALLLFAYAKTVKGSALQAGILLGITALAHPVVAFHGSLAIAFATVCCGSNRWRRLFLTAISSIAIAAPFLLPTLLYVLPGSTANADAVLIKQLIEFRLPHEFDLSGLINSSFLSVMALEIVSALTAIKILHRLIRTDELQRLCALWVAHLGLLVISLVIHGTNLGDSFDRFYGILFSIHLTRTTPLFFALSAILISGALCTTLDTSSTAHGRIPRYALLFSSLTLIVIFVSSSHAVTLAIALCLLGFFTIPNNKRKFFGTILLILITLATSIFVWKNDVISASVAVDDAQLFEWVQTNTSRDSLFVVPPGFQEFRYYAKRSIYVDFKTFSVSTRMMNDWWNRLLLIAQPDERTLSFRGWDGVVEWDRSYARGKNTNSISTILESSGADYLVFDRSTVPVDEALLFDRQILSIPFENQKYLLFQRKVSNSRTATIKP